MNDLRQTPPPEHVGRRSAAVLCILDDEAGTLHGQLAATPNHDAETLDLAVSYHPDGRGDTSGDDRPHARARDRADPDPMSPPTRGKEHDVTTNDLENTVGADTDEDPFARWVGEHAVTLSGLDPAADLDDLESLRDLVGEARVVAVGENSHFIREFALLRHRILRWLVERCDFRMLAFESGFSEGFALDRWAHGEGRTGDLDHLAKEAIASGLARPRQVGDTLRWLREHNDSTGQRHGQVDDRRTSTTEEHGDGTPRGHGFSTVEDVICGRDPPSPGWERPSPAAHSSLSSARSSPPSARDRAAVS